MRITNLINFANVVSFYLGNSAKEAKQSIAYLEI